MCEARLPGSAGALACCVGAPCRTASEDLASRPPRTTREGAYAPLRSRQANERLRPAKPRRKRRLLSSASACNRAAVYELAIASGRNDKRGDQISYHIKATPKKIAAYEAAKLASDFDPQNRDENIDYYVAKFDELVKKFGRIGAEAKAPKQESLAF